MAKIYIDGKPYEVEDGQNLLQASLSLGFNLPYFCWHPALGSVGACRQCAVKHFRNEKDTRGSIVMACMTPADDGTRISINDHEAVQFRASVIEWLMINHPHDCPVCDEGGECHLQDMTVMTGHAYREYRFRKRTHRNQDLGPFITHEMNRCIQCYRCVRYYRDYARGRDFNVFACHDHVYFGRHQDGVLQNEFSGNLVEICPTGVFTDKTFRKHYTRKWDLQTAPSICVHCCLGCNTIPGSRYVDLRRIRNRYNHEVNGYFLCDRGRYGYEFVNSDRRILQPLVRQAEKSVQAIVSTGEALSRAAALVVQSRGVIGIGSPRASVESNFALLTLAGPENFYAGVSDKDFDLLRLVLSTMRDGFARTPSLGETINADIVFILGEDVTNTAPVLALNLCQTEHAKAELILERAKVPRWSEAPVKEIAPYEKATLYIASPAATKLDHAALKTFHATPGALARLGFAVASMLDATAPAASNLSKEERDPADEIAGALKSASRPLVVSGTGCGSRAIIEASANICRALDKAGRPAELFLCLPEVNSLGLALLGAAGGLEAAADAVRSGRADTLVVLENDLFRRAPSKLVRELLNQARHVIAIDHLVNATTLGAEIVLPAATFAESSGSFVNNEGRAQRFFSVFPPKGSVKAGWRWIRDLMTAAGRPGGEKWNNLDDIMGAVSTAIPGMTALPNAAPGAGFRLTGGEVPRQTQRYSGRTAINSNIDVSESEPPDDPDSPLAYSMEGDHGRPPSSLVPRFWAPGWNSVQSLNKYQEEIAGLLRGGSPGVRLIGPQPKKTIAYFQNVLERSGSENGTWVFVPLHHIFGSEELSLLTPGIASLSPTPYVAMNPEDASALRLVEGEPARIELDGSVFNFPVRILPSLPSRVVGLPVGLPGAPVLNLPASGAISKGAGNG